MVAKVEREQLARAQGMRNDWNLDSPSKFLILCLNSIENALLHDDTINQDIPRHLLVNDWGIEFWQCLSSGSDILETTGVCSSVEQIAWMMSTATDIISSKEQEGLNVASPFLLYLVPSQEKVSKVKSVCKPLKAFGVHTMSLHSGASLHYQIQRFKTCEPEFLVSTPERLVELISLNAIEISSVSLLIIDGLENFIRDGFLGKIETIRQLIPGVCQTVVFSGNDGQVPRAAVQKLLGGTISRLCTSDCIASQSACISQSVHVCTSEEKLFKSIEILNREYGNRLSSEYLKVLFIGESGKTRVISDTLVAEGYSISNDTFFDNPNVVTSEKKAVVFVTDTLDLEKTEIDEFEVVIIVNFPQLIDDYVSILTGMARYTVNGVLHSFFSQENAPMAGQLKNILELCGQSVPEALTR